MEICENLYELLKAAVDRQRKKSSGAGFGKVHIEMGYLVSRASLSWLRPDVSLTHARQHGDRYYEGAPPIAFEAVSENDKALRLQGKVVEYLANAPGGLGHLSGTPPRLGLSPLDTRGISGDAIHSQRTAAGN